MPNNHNKADARKTRFLRMSARAEDSVQRVRMIGENALIRAELIRLLDECHETLAEDDIQSRERRARLQA